MKYLLAILFPPIGFFAVGKPFQGILALFLMFTLIGWPIAVIWAWLVINSAHADTRTQRIVDAMKESGEKPKRAKSLKTAPAKKEKRGQYKRPYGFD
jgi:TM2 domain-containing membrane protein YozV